TKELIALGIAITVRCDGCIAFHVHDAMQAGANEAEIAETVSVAILMGGGPSVVYGIEAMQALEQYQAQGLKVFSLINLTEQNQQKKKMTLRFYCPKQKKDSIDKFMCGTSKYQFICLLFILIPSAVIAETFYVNLVQAAIERTNHSVRYDGAYRSIDYPG